MKQLGRRLDLLETRIGNAELSPVARAWLGYPVSADEVLADTPDDYDTRNLSQEAKAWLGID